MLKGQMNIFNMDDVVESAITNEIEDKYTKEQLEKIEELKKEFEVEEVSISKANIVKVAVKYKFKPIVPQGNTDRIIYPKWTHLIYFINELGEILGNPGVGYVENNENIKREGD